MEGDPRHLKGVATKLGCMDSSELQFTRRRLLAQGTALCLAGGSASWAACAAAEPTSRFDALKRPALAVRQPAKAALLAVAATSARIVGVGERGVVALSDDAGKSWRQAQSVPTSNTLAAVRFVDDRTGWAVGHGGVILATTDGGERWVRQADGGVLAAGAQTMAASRAAAGDARAPALLKESALLVADGPDKPLFDLHFMDARRGVAVGAYNLFFETIDGGKTWTSALDRLDNPKAHHLYAMRVRGDTWLLAGEQGLLFRSLDGGKTFQRLASPYAGSWFALAVSERGEWILAGLRGHVFRSTDDGSSWARIDGAPPASFISAATLQDGRVLLANQAGQIFTYQGSDALIPWPAPNLPALSQVLPLAGGDLLAVGLAGVFRLPGKPT
jgi:photosystem II stability/assembly factor-like uncharacterized protein